LTAQATCHHTMFCHGKALCHSSALPPARQCPLFRSLMSSGRQFLFVLTVFSVAAAATGLGRWQLRRLRERRASNGVLLAAGERPALDLTAAVNPVTSIDSGRHVVAHGSFEPQDQIVLRGRVQDDAPGLQIVTTYVLDGGG